MPFGGTVSFNMGGARGGSLPAPAAPATQIPPPESSGDAAPSVGLQWANVHRFSFEFSDFHGRLRPRKILLQKPRTDLRLG